jgi:hypothetical protein
MLILCPQGTGRMNLIVDKLERIKQLWKELERTHPDTYEHRALMRQIRILSKEYQVLVEKSERPK